MQLVLKRIAYHAGGTNGVLQLADSLEPVCFSIELPWLNNTPQRSCIPPGTYRLQQRYSEKFHWHLHLCDVPGRSMILLHPANFAQLELRGCIAPVSELSGPGIGLRSKAALARLMEALQPAFHAGEPVYLTIQPPTGDQDTKQEQ
jgi:hypothetical protein